jgi:hypothetical protein
MPQPVMHGDTGTYVWNQTATAASPDIPATGSRSQAQEKSQITSKEDCALLRVQGHLADGLSNQFSDLLHNVESTS